jgi:glutathione peroxidase
MARLSMVLALAMSMASAVCGLAQDDESDKKATPAALKFTVKNIDGEDVELAKYYGNVVIVVNVASKCGLTPQYEGLEELHDKFAEKGLSILGFPCNQFGNQEPGTDQEIKTFCRRKYDVSFDMFSKIDVNGDRSSGLYKLLTKTETKPESAGDISWNFEKFLIDRSGIVVARFSPKTVPDDKDFLKAIETALAEPRPDDAPPKRDGQQAKKSQSAGTQAIK